MGVKAEEIANDDNGQLDLAALVEHIDSMNKNNIELRGPELVKFCTSLVECLASTPTPVDEEGHWAISARGYIVEAYLHRTLNYIDADERHDLVAVILTKFFAVVTDPKLNACPVTAVVVSVLGGENAKAIGAATRCFIQKAESQGADAPAALAASLGCLYRWLLNFYYKWEICPNALTNWTLSFIEALSETCHDDILFDVSLKFIDQLFASLLHENKKEIAPVFFHIMSCMRESPEVLDRLAPLVKNVLELLAGDSEPWSRQLLQNLVGMISMLIMEQEKRLERCSTVLYEFRLKYCSVTSCLRHHMASGDEHQWDIRPWRRPQQRSPKATASTPTSHVTVGLINAGNTCYANSVVQALNLTKQLRRLAVTRLCDRPYWSDLGTIFAHLNFFPKPTVLDINDFVEIAKPNSFTTGSQNDSFEFLGHLLQLLKSSEGTVIPDDNLYRLVPGSSSEPRHAKSTNASSTVSGFAEPRVGPSGSLKRPLGNVEDEAVPAKFRIVARPTIASGKTYIGRTFGGLMRTCFRCLDCRGTSINRNVFYDLQLAFPELEQYHTVQTLLDYYCSPEMLLGENRYHCERCDGLRDAEKSVSFEKIPRYLIVILKYFKFDRKATVQSKQLHDMYYNRTLVLPATHLKTSKKFAAYELYASVIHQGTTLDAGHFYTIGSDNNSWFLYDDSTIRLIKDCEINELPSTCTPYILFYRRMDVENRPEPTFSELPPIIADTFDPLNKTFQKLHKKTHKYYTS